MIIKRLYNWIYSLFKKKQKCFNLKIVSELPKNPEENTLFLEGNVEEGNFWYALLKCPCGCGDNIMLNLMADAKPCWEIVIDNNSLSITPSIWRTKNCKSHFWIKKGSVVWHDPKF